MTVCPISFDLRRSLLLAGLLLAALLAPASRASAQVAGAGEDAAILPYLDEGTFFVLRLDVDRVDPAAMEKFLNGVMLSRSQNAQVPENVKQQIEERAKESIATAKKWVADMSAAGGKRVYVLVDQADQNGPGDGPVLVVPLGPGANAEKITEVLSRDKGRATVEEVGKAVVMANSAGAERVKNLVESGKAVASPDLAAAFAAAAKSVKDAPIRMAFLPGEATRTWIEENLPMLPPQLGGGETKTLSRGVKYAAAGVSQKPDVLAQVTIRAQDADAAKELFDVLNKGTSFVTESTADTPIAEETQKQIKAMNAKLNGDTITLALNPVFAQNAAMAIAMKQIRAQGGIRPAPGTPQQQPAKPDDGGL